MNEEMACQKILRRTNKALIADLRTETELNAGPGGRSPAEMVCSNPTGGMSVCLSVCLSVVNVVCCQVEVSATG